MKISDSGTLSPDRLSSFIPYIFCKNPASPKEAHAHEQLLSKTKKYCFIACTSPAKAWRADVVASSHSMRTRAGCLGAGSGVRGKRLGERAQRCTV